MPHSIYRNVIETYLLHYLLMFEACMPQKLYNREPVEPPETVNITEFLKRLYVPLTTLTEGSVVISHSNCWKQCSRLGGRGKRTNSCKCPTLGNNHQLVQAIVYGENIRCCNEMAMELAKLMLKSYWLPKYSFCFNLFQVSPPETY